MLVNLSDFERLALDSRCFDKEGFLFVRSKIDGLFQWKTQSYIERLCRLKGNLFFVLATKSFGDGDSDSDPDSTDRVLHILVLEEFTIKPYDENGKYFSFAIEFVKDTCRAFHFATVSHHDRDAWVQAIHLTSFSYLRSLYQTLSSAINSTTNNNNDEDQSNNNVIRSTDSPIILSLEIESLSVDDTRLLPNATVQVHLRTLFKSWSVVGETETVASHCPRFSKNLALPSSVGLDTFIELKFKVYNVIEPVTATRCLLANCYLTLSRVDPGKGERKKLELKSLVNNEVIGFLLVTISSINSKKHSNRKNSLNIVHKDENCNYNDRSAIESRLNRSNSVPNLNRRATVDANMSNILDDLDDSLYSNNIRKSFQFNINNQLLFIDELMAEVPMTIQFPQNLMNMFMDDEKQLMNCMTYSLGEVKSEWQRPQMKALESHLRLVNVLTESLNELSHYQLERNFRPSTSKHEQFLQFVPINFHLQRSLITSTASSCKVVQDIFTVGAFTCHYLGFKKGGFSKEFDLSNKNLQLLNKVWTSMTNFFRIASLKKQIEIQIRKLFYSFDDNFLDIFAVVEQFNQVDALCKKIVTILNFETVNKVFDETLNICDSIRGNMTCVNGNSVNTTERSLSLQETRNHNDDFRDRQVRRNRSLTGEEHQELEPIDLTHLNIRACSISMAGKLNNKNLRPSKSDLEPSQKKLRCAIDSLYRTASVCYACQAIQLDKEQLELFYLMRLRRDMLFSQILSSIVAATQLKLSTKRFLERIVESQTVFIYFESLLSCFSEEMGMLEDMDYIVNEINRCVVFVFEVSTQKNQPRIEGNSFSLKIHFSVQSLPASLNFLECKVLGILFNVGINEQATYAETMGYVKHQDLINKESYLNLESFINHISDDGLLQSDLGALRTEVWSSRVKNVRILTLAESINRRVDGIRFTLCKSAKDRTSMAVTLEETRLITSVIDVNELNSPQIFQQILDTLRIEGTRRENTRKNIGVNRYAFNSLQLLTFPKLYRAPPGTYSALET